MLYKRFTLLLLATVLLAVGASARKSQVQKTYIFGMAASFTDTIVHFTPIVEVDSAWVDSKGEFLLGREEYSYQLRDYLTTELLMPHRTCVVVYDKKLKRLEKRRAKMLRLYTEPRKGARSFDVRHIDMQDFRFHSVDMSATVEQQIKEEQEAKAAAKQSGKPKKEKKDKKAGKGNRPAPPGAGGRGERRPPHE